MNETDRDIEELHRLLGPAVSEYRSLEHHGDFESRLRQRRSFVSLHAFSVAASLLVALALVGILSLDRVAQQDGRPGAQISISTSLPARPTAGPVATGIQRPSVSLSRSSLPSTLPGNPARRDG